MKIYLSIIMFHVEHSYTLFYVSRETDFSKQKNILMIINVSRETL